MKIIKTIAYSLLLVTILVGNSLVIAVTCRNRNLQKTINFLILNMALSDLFVPLFGLPIRIEQIYLPQGRWLVGGAFGSITCKILPFATDVSLIVSVLTLEAIAIERFLGVVYPLQNHTIVKRTKCGVAIALIWVMAAVYPSLNFFKFKIIDKGTKAYCFRSWKPTFSNTEAFKVEAPVLLVCFTIIPFILLTSLYSVIIVSLHRQKGRLQFASDERQRRAKENKLVTYMLLTVVIVFLITWTPFNIYWFLRAYIWSYKRPCDSRHLIFTANFLIYAHPSINPIIYGVFNENYRRGFRELLCCLPRSIPCLPLTEPVRSRMEASNVLFMACRRSLRKLSPSVESTS